MYTRSSDFEERKLKMKKERQNADQEALFEAILTLRSPEECYAFFKDLCTYQELNAMAQRLQVAKMLHSGHVFHEIVEETGASTATISRVNRAIKDGCDGYQIIFERITDIPAGSCRIACGYHRAALHKAGKRTLCGVATKIDQKNVIENVQQACWCT